MKNKTAIIFRKISRAAFVIGTLSLVIGFVLSFMSVPASASGVVSSGLDGEGDNQILACGGAASEFACRLPGCDPDPYYSWSAPNGYQICEIGIRDGGVWIFGSDGCVDVNGDGSGDYCAGGIGTGVGEAERVCTECDPMIGVKFAYEPVNQPTSTPTDTPVIPTDTPTPTDTPVIPTDTPTPTDTPVIPTDTPTPTDTPVIPTDTPTPIIDTSTPTVTGTSPTVTDTSTPPTISATPTSTNTPIASEITPTPTETSTPTPTATQTKPPTLPPPPEITTTPGLIPVTGADLSGMSGPGSAYAGLLINIGFGMLGLALVLHGLGKRLSSM